MYVHLSNTHGSLYLGYAFIHAYYARLCRAQDLLYGGEKLMTCSQPWI